MRRIQTLLPLFTGLTLWAASSSGLPLSEQTFQQFQSPFLEFVTPTSDYANEEALSYPIWARLMLINWLKYDPNTSTDASSADCSSQKWLQQYRQDKISKNIDEYIRRCDKQLQSGWSSSAVTTYLTMMLKLQPEKHPYGRFVILHLPNGNRLKGFLALKGDAVKRPLVILRLGIFSNVTAFLPERFMFLQLFEQSPFNVLVLESNSSREFIVRNKTLALGGFDEGIQNFLIAKKLQEPTEPISHIVDGVHVAAMSMGGHGAMFASLLNDWDNKKRKPTSPVIRSVFAYCPLLNFRDTMDFHLAQEVESMGFDYWVSNRLHGVDNVISGLDQNHFVQSLMNWEEKKYQGPVAYDESLPLNEIMKSNLKNFWQENQFWPFYKDVQTPVLILATETDPIVPFQINSQRILNKHMNLGNSQVQVVPLQAGLHCNLPGSYQWRPMASVAQAYILNNGEFKPEKVTRSIALSKAELANTTNKGFPPKYSLQPGREASEFEIKLELSNSPLVEKSLTLSMQDLGYADSNFSISKEMVQRWLDQNLHFELIEASDQSPQLVLTWYR